MSSLHKRNCRHLEIPRVQSV